MNSDQIGGILRAILSAAGGVVAGHGFITADLWTTISGAIVAVAMAFWSWHTNQTGKVIGASTTAAK